MEKTIFALLLVSQAVVCMWPFESSNELCSEIYKCNCSEKRKTVDCSNLAITELTSKLSFASVEGVFFKNNKIGKIEKNFGKGESVKEIDFSNNAVAFIQNSAFSLFPNLLRLDISHNRVWNLGTDVFAGLSSLQTLDLSFNNIQSFFDTVFERTPHLKKLILKFNPLVSLDDSRFQYLTELEYLDLQLTGLATLGDDLFSHNPSLKYLFLGSNVLEKVPSQSFRSSAKLITLDLSDNPIATIGAGAFKGLNHLNSLHINRMSILDRIHGYAFQGLINLRNLYCSYNYKLVEIDPLAFASNGSLPLKSIEVVHLRDNALTTLSRKLLNWNYLYHSDLSGNPWNCDCELKWMHEITWKHDLQYNIRCAAPPQHAGKLVGTMKREDFTCQHHMSAELIVTLTLLTTVAFSAALAAIGVIFSRKGWCAFCRSRIQTKYHAVSKVKEVEIDYEPKE